MLIRYHGHDNSTGYGRAAGGYIGALETEAMKTGDHSVQVFPVLKDTGPKFGPPIGDADVAIYHTTPSRLASLIRWPAKKHVALTTWETEPCPLEHLKTLETFDAVITPSRFCCDLFLGRGTVIGPSPIHVVPHGFDPNFWVQQERPLNDVFTFYSIGAWGERKNTLGLLKAYLSAFTKADQVRLVLVVDKVNFPAIHSVLARSGVPQEQFPGLVIPDQRLSDSEILQLHRDGDCFVTATRSEGFGLPIFEAAIMGKPIIAPRWGGHTEFLGAYGPWRQVWHSMTPVFFGEDELEIEGNVLRVKTSAPAGSNCQQKWAEPSLDRLAECMRFVVADRREGLWIDAKPETRPWFERNYSYEAIGKKFLDTLKEIIE